MKTKTLKQTATFSKASPQEIYDTFMDPKKHADLIGGRVTMSDAVNGKFRMYEGYCTGYNIELKKGKKIVQAWHFKEEGWPKNHYSECTFTIEKKGEGVKLTFTQTGIPEHLLERLKNGWKDFYWMPMKYRFRKNR